MGTILEIIKQYGSQISAIAAATTLIFTIYKYQIDRKTALYWKEFKIYHKLVKELVEPSPNNGYLYVDRQTAILFELTNFKRYYPHTLRMLKGLYEKWSNTPNQFPRLMEELNLTINYISKKCQ